MMQYVLTIRYDGSCYHGWQVQKNAVTVQQVLQDAIEKVFGSRLDVKGCSRTDSGVHANQYFVSFHADRHMPGIGVVRALNTALPLDIAVIDCWEAGGTFHPRYDCVSKQYIYKLYNGRVRDPFLEKYAYHYRYPLDAEDLDREAQAFIGTHDFCGFCCAKSDVADTVRTVQHFSVRRKGDMVLFTVEADGFLYNMVRIMVGTLLFVGEGKIKAGELPAVLASKCRRRAGKTVPPHGLYLNRVTYPKEVWYNGNG